MPAFHIVEATTNNRKRRGAMRDMLRKGSQLLCSGVWVLGVSIDIEDGK